jgi:hypothetical protein
MLCSIKTIHAMNKIGKAFKNKPDCPASVPKIIQILNGLNKIWETGNDTWVFYKMSIFH